MSSPTRALRRSPPRKPLHEWSNSSLNEIPSPTLRIIGNADAKVYASSPFPSQSSHILVPGGRQPLVVLEDDHDVSDSRSDKHTTVTSPEQQGSSNISIKPAKGKEIAQIKSSPSGDGSYSDSDAHNVHQQKVTDPAQPSASSRLHTNLSFAKIRTPAQVAKSFRQRAMEYGDEDESSYSDEVIQLPSTSSSGSRHRRAETLDDQLLSTGRAIETSHLGVVEKSSDSSLSTVDSADTVIKTMPQGPPPRGSYTLFPSHQRSASMQSYSSPLRSHPVEHLQSDRQSFYPSSPSSAGSPTSSLSPVSPADTPERGFLIDNRGRQREEEDQEPEIQYPIIRPPRASGSWAQSNAIDVSKRLYQSRDADGLSTIVSEGTQERSSGSMQQLSSPTSSMVIDRISDTSYLQWPTPMHARNRDATGSTIRIVGEEGDDTLTDMPTSPLRHQTSSFFSSLRGEPRSNSMMTTASSTRGSFLRDSIPAWARTYYAHETRNANLIASSPSRPGTRDSVTSPSFPNPLNKWRTRSKPQLVSGRQGHGNNRESLVIRAATPMSPDGPVIRGSALRKKTSSLWSPHLRYDHRHISNRRSMFRAPSLDEDAEGKKLNRRNVQVWMFAIGFVFPLAWWLAAILPLPRKPAFGDGLGIEDGERLGTGSTVISHGDQEQNDMRTKTVGGDLEKQVGPTDLARYENARWWRTLNRIMSAVGVIVIALVVALAVIATKR
ncbi:hypothetical protein MMC25_007343 [Agyrium rufum]|nr:hypothetical protein [Agyrium rufum]